VRASEKIDYRMRLKRALTHILFALALLLGQQAAFAHAATHLGNSPATQDQQLPHAKVCDQCVQCAQFGAALVDLAPPASQTWVPSLGYLTNGVSVHVPAPLHAFSSRAPPAYL
jgi:hypothetical protein